MRAKLKLICGAVAGLMIGLVLIAVWTVYVLTADNISVAGKQGNLFDKNHDVIQRPKYIFIDE